MHLQVTDRACLKDIYQNAWWNSGMSWSCASDRCVKTAFSHESRMNHTAMPQQSVVSAPEATVSYAIFSSRLRSWSQLRNGVIRFCRVFRLLARSHKLENLSRKETTHSCNCALDESLIRSRLRTVSTASLSWLNEPGIFHENYINTFGNIKSQKSRRDLSVDWKLFTQSKGKLYYCNDSVQ